MPAFVLPCPAVHVWVRVLNAGRSSAAIACGCWAHGHCNWCWHGRGSSGARHTEGAGKGAGAGSCRMLQRAAVQWNRESCEAHLRIPSRRLLGLKFQFPYACRSRCRACAYLQYVEFARAISIARQVMRIANAALP